MRHRAAMDITRRAMDESEAVVSTDALIVTLTVSQFRAIVARAATEAVERAIVPRAEWMTRQEVAEMLGYEESYVSELVRRRGLPAHQPGGRGTRQSFKRSEVERWLREGKR